MACNQSVTDLGRAAVHTHHAHNLAQVFLIRAARHTFGLGPAHQRDKGFTQLASGHGVDGVAAGFARHALKCVVRVLALQISGNMVTRPFLLR